MMSTTTITQRQRWKFIFLIGGLQALQPFSLDPYLPSGPIIARDFAVDNSLIQLTLSALTVGFAIGQLVAGPLSDAIGRRKPLLFASTLYVLASYLVFIAPSMEFFFAARLLQGMSGAAALVVGNAIIRDLYEGLPMLKMMGRVLLIQASAWFIGPFAGSQLLVIMDWRGVSLILGCYAVFMLVASFMFLTETLHRDNRRDTVFAGMLKRFAYVLHDRIYVGLLLVQIMVGIGLWAYLSAMPFVFTQQFGLAPEQYGLLLTLNSVGAYIGVQLSSKLAQYIPAQWLLVGALSMSLIVGAILTLISNTQPPLWLVAGLIWLFLVAFGLTVTPIGALSLAPHPNEAGTAASLMLVLGSLATSAAGPLYAALPKETAFGVGLTMVAAHLISLTVMFTVVRPKSVPALT